MVLERDDPEERPRPAREPPAKSIRGQKLSETAAPKTVAHGDEGHTPSYEKTTQKGVAEGYPGLDFQQLVEQPVQRIDTDLDANKDPSPSVGDMFAATDTSKFYICFAAGIWKSVTLT